MSENEKFENTKDKVTGKIKETAGKLTGDKKQETEGKIEGITAKVKDKLEDAKDVAEGVIDKVKDSLDGDKDK